LFLAGNAVAMTGNGLVIAFTLIYLHQARGIALPVVGVLLAASAAAGLLVVTVSGVLLDRLGARPVLTGIMLGQAAGQVPLAWAHDAASALPALLLYGATWAPMFPALATVIGGLTPDPAAQQRVFAVNFTVQNAALAVGTLLEAAVANVHHPGSFHALFLVNAVSCLIFAAVPRLLPTLHTAPQGRSSEPATGTCLPTSASGSYWWRRSSLRSPATRHLTPGCRPTRQSKHTCRRVRGPIAHHQHGPHRARPAVRVAPRPASPGSSALAVSGLILAVSWAVLGLAALPTAPIGRAAFVFGFTALRAG
jgi:MFS family permease